MKRSSKRWVGWARLGANYTQKKYKNKVNFDKLNNNY